MPRPGCGWATREDWLRFYRITKEDGTVVTMGDDRTWSPDNPENEVHRRVEALIARGIGLDQRIVVLGCGPGGFLIEAFKLHGRPNCWGVDSSPWVESRKGIAQGDILWLNSSFTGNIGNAMRTMTGDNDFDWVITESVLESYLDSEITVGLNACEGLRYTQSPMSQIVHIVLTPPFDEPGVFNEKTMAQWKAMRPAHTWMNGEGYEVI